MNMYLAAFSFLSMSITCTIDSGRAIRRRGGKVIVGNGILNASNRPVVNTSMLIGNSAAKIIASLSNGCALSGISGKTVLRFDCMNCMGLAGAMKGRAAVGTVLCRSSRVLRKIRIITFNARGGRDIVNTVSAIGITRLGAPSDGLAGTLTKHVTKMVSCREANRPKISSTSFFIHNIAAFKCGGSPLVLVSNVRLASASLTHLRPSSVTDFSVVGSTATATLCNTHNTGNIVLIGAGRNRGKGTQLDLEIRGSVSAPARRVRLTSPIACVHLRGRTCLAHGPLTPLVCSRRGVSGAMPKTKSMVCPTAS